MVICLMIVAMVALVALMTLVILVALVVMVALMTLLALVTLMALVALVALVALMVLVALVAMVVLIAFCSVQSGSRLQGRPIAQVVTRQSSAMCSDLQRSNWFSDLPPAPPPISVFLPTICSNWMNRTLDIGDSLLS